MMKHEEIEYQPVNKDLSQPIYKIDFLHIKLTLFEIYLSLITALCVFGVITTLGLENKVVFGVRLDPWGWIFSLVGMVIGISIGHYRRPYGQIECILDGLFAPKIFVPSMDDCDWHPSDIRIYLSKPISSLNNLLNKLKGN